MTAPPSSIAIKEAPSLDKVPSTAKVAPLVSQPDAQGQIRKGAKKEKAPEGQEGE